MANNQPNTVWRTYRFRVYPTKRQVSALEAQLAEACRLYNAAIQERRDAWRMQGHRITFRSQRSQLKDIRRNGDIGIPNFKIAADVVRRADLAFQAFFRRVASGQKPGFPRFRPTTRYDSLGTPEFGKGIWVRDGRLYVSGVGSIRVKWHRRAIGTTKTARIVRDGDHWHLLLSAEVEASPLPPSESAVGIDVGLSSFIATSDNVAVEAPRFYRTSQPRLRRKQRHVARGVRGSRRNDGAMRDVRSAHRRVRNRRADFAHKLSREIVNRYGFIAVEKLNIKGLARTRLAKSIHDAGWRLFLNQLAYKAESAGREFVEVDAAGTSQTCVCGASVPKRLSDRWHSCAACGMEGPRDVVSAQVILARGQRAQARTGPMGAVVCGGQS